MTDHAAKVLIVDDQEANLVALRGLLRRCEAETLVARSGQEALELLLVQEVALAIVDVQMPVMDGFELAELMRSVERTRHVPIMFLTAGDFDNARRFRGYDAGAVDFLYKPIDPEVLYRKVDVFVRLSRQRQDLARQRDELRAIAEEKSRLVHELQESEARFRALADNMSQLAWMMDEQGRVYWYNRRWYDYTGTTYEDMQGAGWRQVHHPEHVDRVVASKQRSLETGEPWDETFPLRGKDGQYRWFLTRGVPIHDAQGAIVRWFGTNTDVTEQRRVEEKLREREEELRLFSAQLEQLVGERTDELTQSQGQLRALATDLNLTEQRERKRLATELHDHLAQMLVLCRLKLGQSKRMAGVAPECQQLIKQTEEVLDEALTYTRTLVADLAPPVLHDFGLPVALKWLAEFMERHELAVKVAISGKEHIELPEDQAVLLFQSVRELLMNVSKHANTNAAVVSLARKDGSLHIEVRDEGQGMASLPIQSRSSKFGLFSIRERMSAMGGVFELESAQGRGTTARLVLPLTNSAEPKVLSPEQSDVREAALRTQRSALPSDSGLNTQGSALQQNAKIRVLLVDDHAMVRQGLRTLLDGYADVTVVGEAANGEEAVESVERLHPSIVVMDINMPKMNGIDATADIKVRFPETVVIGLSVQANGEAQDAMRKAGATLLLTKEAAVDELYESIRRTLTA